MNRGGGGVFKRQESQSLGAASSVSMQLKAFTFNSTRNIFETNFCLISE